MCMCIRVKLERLIMCFSSLVLLIITLFEGKGVFLGEKRKKIRDIRGERVIRIDAKLEKKGIGGGSEVNDTARRSILNLFRSLNRARTSWFPGVNKFSSASHSPRNCIHPLYTETEITVPDIKIYTSLLRLEINGPPCLFPSPPPCKL